MFGSVTSFENSPRSNNSISRSNSNNNIGYNSRTPTRQSLNNYNSNKESFLNLNFKINHSFSSTTLDSEIDTKQVSMEAYYEPKRYIAFPDILDTPGNLISKIILIVLDTLIVEIFQKTNEFIHSCLMNGNLSKIYKVCHLFIYRNECLGSLCLRSI